MKRLFVFLLFASGTFAATTATITTDGVGATHVGTTMTTALGFANPTPPCNGNTVCYAGATITITGSLCTGGAPCTWTLKDQNNDTVSTVSTTGAAGAVNPLGQIDCTGSAANIVCVYNAPVEYPSTQVVTVGITDGSTSATVTVNFIYTNGLNEYWTHLGRTRLVGTANGINNIPLNIYSLGGSPITYSPLQTNFIDTFIAPSIEAALLTITSDNGGGAGFPSTAGSSINRPAFSFDGRWFGFVSNQQWPNISSGASQFVQHTDGTSLQRLNSTCFPILSGGQPMWEKNQPNWLLTIDSTKLYVCDLANAQAASAIATHGVTNPQVFTYENGLSDNLYPIRTQNAGSCNPILLSCSVQMSTFDISPCYAGLTSTCASLSVAVFNSFLNLSSGFDANGNAHCVTIDTLGPAPQCEWHFHDIFFIPRSINLVWNYGPFGTVGETLFYQGDVNGDLPTVVPIFPNTATNVAYMSHPAFNHSSPSLVAYAGMNGCAPLQGLHTCNNSSSGNVVWDFRSNTSIFFDANVGVGHSAWDGFYLGYFGHDSGVNSPTDIFNGCSNQTMSEEFLSAGNGNPRRIFQSYGCRAQNVGGPPQSYLFSPVQSPDATKYAYAMTVSQQCNLACPGGTQAIRLGWMYFAHKPVPPVNVTLSGTSSALVQWTPSPLSYETHLYWIYKQPSCTGAWTRLNSVTGVFRQFTPYTFTDGALGSGSNACYGLTTQEWSGQESDHLSNIVKITNTAGVFSKTQMAGEGTIGFVSSSPSDVGSLAVAQKLLCGLVCTSSAPAAPTLLASGTGITGNLMWGAISYCKYLDFPANLNPICTPITINTTGLNLVNQGMKFFTSGNEMVGQDAIQFYMSGPSGTQPAANTFHLQTPSSCDTFNALAPTILLNNNNGNTGSLAFCTVTSFNAASATPPVTNTAIGGYLLTWTDPGGVGDRYEQIYYREGAAVVLSQGEVTAQQYLVGTVPIGTLKFYDAFPNQATTAANVHYAVVVKRMDGTRSTGICMKGDGTADTCL